MNISANRSQARWESPTDYIGPLSTTGKGVGVVVMDEGFDLTHPDLKGRVVGVATVQGDRFDSDPLGHGTHTLGVVGASGESSEGRIRGVAPEAKLFAMKVKLAQGEGLADSIDSINRGMHWIVQNKDEHNIKVVNCSFVLPTLQSQDSKTGALTLIDPLAYALDLAQKAGITVVAGVGNFADKVPIATPAGNPSVIAVGALDTSGTPQDLQDDKVAKFSSRGASIHGQNKPDILAPGVDIMSTLARGSESELQNKLNAPLAQKIQDGPVSELQTMARDLVEKGSLTPLALKMSDAVLRKVLSKFHEVKATEGSQGESPAYIAQKGTSESAPIVTGVIAHMYEVNPELTPEQVKEILFSTARPVPGEPEATGRGALNAQAAIEAAAALRA